MSNSEQTIGIQFSKSRRFCLMQISPRQSLHLLLALCATLALGACDSYKQKTSPTNASGVTSAAAAVACPSQDLKTFVAAFAEDVALQKAFTAETVDAAFVDMNAQPEPAESVKSLSREKLRFPVMPNRAQQQKEGLQYREVSNEAGRAVVVLEIPDTDAQLLYTFRRDACWTLVKIVDPAYGEMSAAARSGALQTDVAPPSNGMVVADIYGNAEGGEYWFGQEFRLGGQRYYVGFAHSTPTPDGQVPISHATYSLSGAQWQKIATAKEIGRFGMNDQAPVFEKGDQSVEFVDGDHRYSLAVPAWHSEMSGVEMHTAEIFFFDGVARTWKYQGSVYTGENNDAGCTDEGKTVSGAACTKSIGKLKFLSKKSAGFPGISVTRSGTTLGNDRQARTLGVADAIDYTYAASSSAYIPLEKK